MNEHMSWIAAMPCATLISRFGNDLPKLKEDFPLVRKAVQVLEKNFTLGDAFKEMEKVFSADEQKEIMDFVPKLFKSTVLSVLLNPQPKETENSSVGEEIKSLSDNSDKTVCQSDRRFLSER